MIKTLGIRREDKNKWEARVPLTPEDVKRLIENCNLNVLIQPSTIRVFKDYEYEKAGAVVSEDLSSCDAILGVKEIPVNFFEKNKMYLFFSHTIKGQPENMPMLRRMIELECTLVDYEKITDDNGKRLVFFGRYAGIAGMIDTLWAFGKRLNALGYKTPFEKIQQAYKYKNFETATKHIIEIAQEIQRNGLPKDLLPIVVGFAGYGNVSKGAQEVFDLFPHRSISPQELLSGNFSFSSTEMIKVVFYEHHTVELISKDRNFSNSSFSSSQLSNSAFDLKHFYSNPEMYQSAFYKYLDKLSILMNCIYWTPMSPRLITVKEAKQIWLDGLNRPKLLVIGDISCDLRGAIEFNYKFTTPDNPVYMYNPQEDKIEFTFEGNGPIVLAVDNLPCELALDASEAFSKALYPLIEKIGEVDLYADFNSSKLPLPLKRATILWKGEFTPDFKYMEKYV